MHGKQMSFSVENPPIEVDLKIKFVKFDENQFGVTRAHLVFICKQQVKVFESLAQEE